MACQKRRRTSRRSVGIPSDPNFGRTDLFHLVMIDNTFHGQVLRRLIESGLGWTCQPINGIPHWTAPAWLDQTPQRNHAHDPIAVT
jgi:hypothetical protein